MNVLIIKAQPSEKGFIHQIAQQYEGTSKTKGDNVEIIDLYAPEYQMPFLQFENQKHIPENETRTLLQQKIKNAHKLVFVFPMWWGEYPAIVKNFIDNVFMAGFAFRFEGRNPIGMLTTKTAEVYMTCDAPRWLYFFIGFPFKKLFTKQILGFCGIQVSRFKLFGNISSSTPEKKSSILQKITSFVLS